MNVIIQKLTAEDLAHFVELIHVFEAEFEMAAFRMPPPAHLQGVLQQDSFWAFIALVDGQVVGGLTAYVLPPYYTRRAQAYLYDMAVSAPYQRKGIGRQLITALADYARARDFDALFVQADGDDNEAIDFYRATGGIAAPVIQFTYPLTDS